MTEQEKIGRWDVAQESTIIDDLKNAPQNQAAWEDKFKGLPQTIAVSPAICKVLMEGKNG